MITRVFGTKRVTETVGVSPIGGPLCRFALGSSNIGVPGTVTVTVGSAPSLAAFHSTQRSTPGAVAISHLGVRAFYTPTTGTVQLIDKGKRVVVQATLRVPGSGTPKPKALKAAVVRLARSVATGI